VRGVDILQYRGVESLYSRQHARSVAAGLCAHSTRERRARAGSDYQARAAQCVDPVRDPACGGAANAGAGAAITESVFNWPGMGRLLVDALGRSDYTVAMSILFISTVLVLIGYLISDILYTVVDPRIRLT
jgi:hypothetical protein